jgi:hypothetical protein
VPGHVEDAVEPMGLGFVTDAALEAPQDSVGLRRARWRQSVLNPQILVRHIEAVIPLGVR